MDARTENEILLLHNEGKWEEIIDNYDKNKFLPWIWPDRKCLDFIGTSVLRQNGKFILSIGCGSGLFEWLLTKSTGVEVTGVEIDGNWWKSKYSLGTFVPMLLVDDSKKGDFGDLDTRNSVLLFCYFNNSEAFLNYLGNFAGNCFIVIGPGPGRGTYTIPQPFHLPGKAGENWKLSESQEIRSSKDFVAIYVRR